MAQCYYCNGTIPEKEIKRCARCRLVFYCSKGCQATSWRVSHRRNCIPHPSVVLPDGAIRSDKPAKGSEERINLDIDQALSTWMARWRFVFQTFTTVALDLSNHPPERVITHCLYLVIEPRDEDLSKCKNYRLLRAEIVPVSYLDGVFPEFGGIVEGPDAQDTSRLRFVLLLEDGYGNKLRMRRLQWNDRGIEERRKIPMSEKDLKWAETLRFAVENLDPEDVVPDPWSTS